MIQVAQYIGDYYLYVHNKRIGKDNFHTQFIVCERRKGLPMKEIGRYPTRSHAEAVIRKLA